MLLLFFFYKNVANAARTADPAIGTQTTGCTNHILFGSNSQKTTKGDIGR